LFALPGIVFLAASVAGYETKRPPFPLRGRDIVIDRIRLGQLRIQRPAAEELASISYVSKYPAISSVLLFLYVLLIIYLSRRAGTAGEGLKLGFTFSFSNSFSTSSSTS
jgi:hypothetical protein